MAYIGRGVHESDRNATDIEAQLIPRFWYIWVVNSGKAARACQPISSKSCKSDLDLPIPARHRTTTLPARTLEARPVR
jgi:hypothetical protein